MTTAEVVKAFIQVATLALGIVVFFHGVSVYRKQKYRDNELGERSDRLRRFEKFQEMQKRYREDPSINAVLQAMYHDQYPDYKVPLADVPPGHKFVFMGFYEEVAVMVNSRLMDPDMAYWTLGQDAAFFYNVEKTWHADKTWTLFNTFAQEVAARCPRISEAEIVGMKF